MAVQLLITNRNLVVQGDPLTGWRDLDATVKFNEPGSGSVTLTAWPEVMAQLQPGNRLEVIRDNRYWMGGPMEIPTDYTWSISDEGEPDPGRVTINFSDDLATIAGYITWPVPVVAWTGQVNTWRTIGPETSEEIIRRLVTENCGPTARAERRIPNFVLDAAAGVGTATNVSTRFEPLLDTCRRVAVAGGGIGFRTWRDGGQIKFGCYAPRDRTATARFSQGLGNLRYLGYKQSAPTVTHALVAGSEPEGGGPAGRKFVEAADTAAAAAWWRVEKYVDGSEANDDKGELTNAGKVELADGAAPIELSTITIDTPDLKAGRDFGLGDRVTVALPNGLQATDLVRSIHLQASPNSGEYVSTLVGSSAATSDPQMVQLVRTLSRRLGRLETR
ncbi:siphovirus ReqiPepy6 Gp37-like family protein [Streptomyces sp. NPDC088353]|uniref:siphovirus ReqiPepy6 Gp37-like family protein n=1 Tax=Streptomyces sp. NPDC088353 TaxID=3365855 RepID=UPI00382B351B